MSGHSKWSTIKRAKEVNDLKKARYFTKALNQIVVSVKDGGDSIESNFMLKLAIDNAKSLNIPIKSIENAIKKGKGEDKEYSNFENTFYEAYGPENVSILIECFTDNKNRLISEIRTVLDRNGGKLLNNGTIGWQFELQVLFTLKIETEIDRQNRVKYGHNNNKLHKITDIDKFENNLIDVDGIIDYYIEENELYIYILPEKMQVMRRFLEEQEIIVDNIEKTYISKVKVEISEENFQKLDHLVDMLSSIENVENVYINI
jgi:YebC/PmpR family DNA-binding regulatory protein